MTWIERPRLTAAGRALAERNRAEGSIVAAVALEEGTWPAEYVDTAVRALNRAAAWHEGQDAEGVAVQ